MVRRDNAQKRKPGSRQPKERILVVCCGARTEKQYLDGMRRHFRNSPVAIMVKPEVGAPSQLVGYAAKLKQQDPDGFDEVWCVVDVDDFKNDVAAAVTAASKGHIRLAISNPCFELWLVLHFAEQTAWLDGPGAAKAQLCRYLASYDKTKLDFTVYVPGIPAAIQRARELPGDHRDNPSTGMWQLAEIIAG